MMKRLSFLVTEDGKLPEGIKSTLKWVIPSFAGKKVELSIGEAKDKRSLDQNAYYWTVVVPHVQKVRLENGDPVTEDTVHEDLLFEFSPRVDGKCIKINNGKRPMRSKEMSVKEFSDYVTAITSAMAAFGNPVPTRKE